MKYDSFRYDFTPTEMAFLLFGNKHCPNCKHVMLRRKKFEHAKGSDFNTRSAAPFRQDADVKHYYYVYNCLNCGAEYKLSDLANR